MTTAPTAKVRGGWRTRLVSSPRFQAWAARFPLTRGLVRRDGEALFDLVAGFCHTQVLRAVVELEVLDHLARRPLTAAQLTGLTGVPEPRMVVLARAAVQLDLLGQRRDQFRLTRKGAALTGVPGLAEMIRHHDVLYGDLADPAAFFRGETEPKLANFWPYVFGEAGDPAVSERYSKLMAQSLGLVADDTLAAVSLRQTRHLMDIGGGTGAFIERAAAQAPSARFTLFDLPPVVPAATARFEAAGLTSRCTIHPGSFRDDPLPEGADTISLIRVLYDHEDATVARLLAKTHRALPVGGRLIISEPMAGSRSGDAYFALYTMAMGTGKTRRPEEIAKMLVEAGFSGVRALKTRRAFVTSVVTAERS